MRNLALFAVAGLASVAIAQSPLNMGLTPNNQGNVGGGLYFNLTVLQTLRIDEINFGVGSNTAQGSPCSVNIWLGPQTYVGNVTNPGLWVLVGSTNPVSKATAGYEVVTGATVQPIPQALSVTLAPGNYAIALETVGCQHGYTNGSGCAGSAPPGTCTNATGTTAELELRGGQAQNAFLAGGVFSPRIFAGNIVYTTNPGDPPLQFAARESYGEGCYSNYQSWYEYWRNPFSIDYENTSLLMTFNSATGAYDVTTGTTPVDTVSLVNPPLGHLADGEILISISNPTAATQLVQPILYAGQGGTQVATEVNMNADGFLTLQGEFLTTWAGASIVPDIFAGATPLATSSSQIPAVVGNFKDLDPSIAGSTHFDFNGTENLFTWQAVPDAGGTAGNTIQIAIDAAGNIEIRWGIMSVGGGGGNPAVVGYAVSGGLDPGTIDFTVAVPFSTQANDSNPLVLTADANPIIGTTVNLTVSEQTPNPGLGITFVTEVQLSPGIDLGIIGAPGCLAHVDIGTGVGFAVDSIPLNGLTVAFPIPNQTNIAGLSFYCQSCWLDPAANAFGVKTSNGLRLQIGNF